MMSFLESYKRLDNLCKDVLGSETGITAYISNMEQNRNAYFQSADSDFDYKQLKRYRRIRNQIVHENGVDETYMCNENDTRWIEQFHQRIIDQTDPLTLYHKAETAHRRQEPESKKAGTPVKRQRTPKLGIALPAIVVIGVIAVFAISLLLWSRG